MKPITSRSSESKEFVDNLLQQSLADGIENAAGGDEDGESQGGGHAKQKGGKAGKPHIHLKNTHHAGEGAGAGGADKGRGAQEPGSTPSDSYDAKQTPSAPQEHGQHQDHLGNESSPHGGQDASGDLDEHFRQVDALFEQPKSQPSKNQKTGGSDPARTGDTASTSTSTSKTPANAVNDATQGLKNVLATGSDATIATAVKKLSMVMQAAGQGSQVNSKVSALMTDAGISVSKQAKLASAAGLSSATSSATDPESHLQDVLSSDTSSKSDVEDATEQFIDDARSSGSSDSQINDKLNAMAKDPGSIANLSAAALVAAVKAGLNPNNTDSGAGESIKAQNAINKAKRQEDKQKQEAAQQAAQEYANSGGGGSTGGTGGSGESGGTSGTTGSNNGDSVVGSGKDGEAAKKVSDVPVMSMDELANKVPAKLKAIFPTIEAAAKQYNIPPQLLVAIAMTESTGGTDQAAYANGGGMFQFTDEGAWKEYGSGVRSDDNASAKASANYMATLINQSNGDLSAALRSYNGPIGQGGNPDYQKTIYGFMNGQGY